MSKSFAIFITSYNYGEFIGQAIESVQNQSDPDWQLYILDNGSTDNTYEVVMPFLSDERIHWRQRPENIGAIPNIIAGFNEISADYISTLQADDWLESNFVADAKAAFANPENQNIPFVAFGWKGAYLKENGEIGLQRCLIPFPDDFQGKVFLSPHLTYDNFVSMHNIVFCREKLLNVLPKLTNSKISVCIEILLMQYLESEFGACYLNAACHGYWRRHENQITKNKKLNQSHIEGISLTLLYCSSDFADNSKNNLQNLVAKFSAENGFDKNAELATKFLSLAGFLNRSAPMPYKEAVEFLLSERGQAIATLYGLNQDDFLTKHSKELSALAFSVSLSLAIFANRPVLGEGVQTTEAIIAWVNELQNEFGFDECIEILTAANSLFNGLFMPSDFAVRLANQSDSQLGLSPKTMALQQYAKLLNSHKIAMHEAPSLDRLFNRADFIPTFDLVIACKSEYYSQLTVSINYSAKLLYDDFRVVIISPDDMPDVFGSNPRLQWRQVDSNSDEDLWQGVADYVDGTSADWFIVLEAGDVLADHSLAFMAERMLTQAEKIGEDETSWKVIYVDEDSIEKSGKLNDPYFKPDYSQDYLLSANYISDGVFLNSDAVRDIGGLVVDDLQNECDPIYGAILRILKENNFDANVIGHVPDALYHRYILRSLNRNAADMMLAVQNILGDEFVVNKGYLPNTRDVVAKISDENNEVLWIVKAVDNLEVMQRLINETFPAQQKLNAEKFSISLQLAVFVEADDLDDDVLNFLDEADQQNNADLAFYLVREDSNVQELMDLLIEQSYQQNNQKNIFISRGDILPTAENWLFQLISHVQMPNVGLVAPRLLTTQGNIVGNALVLGSTGVATFFAQNDSFSNTGHMCRQLIVQNPSAVTFDAVLVKSQTWMQVGGLSADFDNDTAAIDFCLRLAKNQENANVVWNPNISLIATQGNIDRPILTDFKKNVLMERWLPEMARDKFYNPNYSRETLFALTEQPQVSKLRLSSKPIPRIIAIPGDAMGCGHYRVLQPFNAAMDSGLIDGFVGQEIYNPFDLSIFEADTLYMQRPMNDASLKFLRNTRQFSGLKLVYELDDLVTSIPEYNLHKAEWPEPEEVARRLQSGLQDSDRIIVTTEALQDIYGKYIEDVRVVPNYIDLTKWGSLQAKRGQGSDNKPRVGWAGGISHFGDLQEIFEVVKTLADEVDWIFLGYCPDEIRPYVKEFHAGIATPDYPAKLASLNLDLAIAPLTHNDFNNCKSHLKLLEYGVLGYATIASDFGPYQGNFPVTLVQNTAKAWIDAIREHINDLNATYQRGDELKSFVLQNHILQDHLDEWCNAWLDF